MTSTDPTSTVIGLSSGHDGAYAVIDRGRVTMARAAELDGRPRHAPFAIDDMFELLELYGDRDIALAVSGWEHPTGGSMRPTFGGYDGLAGLNGAKLPWAGQLVPVHHVPHECAHIRSATALAPPSDVPRRLVLVWEGAIGAFYWVHRGGEIERIGGPVGQPGVRYLIPYGVSSATVGDDEFIADRLEFAGKTMALAALTSDPVSPSPHESRALELIMTTIGVERLGKADFRDMPAYNAGVDSEPAVRLMRLVSDALLAAFDRYLKGVPGTQGAELLIAGGCGLNCGWNSHFTSDGWVSSVFVPPCPNDSGVALGAAAEAFRLLYGDAWPTLDWRVDCGLMFQWDAEPQEDRWLNVPATMDRLARLLRAGGVLAWVDGRSELGPRALGHRSLLAEPFRATTRDRLNRIKQREWYRPVAPVVLADRAADFFAGVVRSDHMLYLADVTDPRLAAITHVDGTARLQTITRGEGSLAELLAHLDDTGTVPVLCNTSLNSPGRGFINRMSDLQEFCFNRGVDAMYVDGKFYARRGGGDTTKAASS